MSHVQNAIAALLEQLLLIREKARESENVVKEITRDIRNLDIAKRNVVSSMTALKRLQMLVNGVDQLQRLAESKRYREAASSLQAVRSLLDFFQAYRGVERIASAYKQVNELQSTLRTNITKDFENFFLHDPNRPVRSTSLPESALVIDAIGPDAKASLIDWYCSLQLREYRRIFRATDEAGQLDNVSRRFAWFRRILKIHEDEHAPAFLDRWHAERWLIRKFADVTKEDLRSVLIREQSRLNVATLMEALNSTLEFEAAMARKYNVPFEELIAPPPASTSSGSQPQPQPQPPSQVQTLSAIFDPYLGVFVDAQDRALSEMFMASLTRPNPPILTAASSTGSTTVLPSSTELFYFYRQTLEQCARLSNREPLRDLYQVYRKWLRVYAEDVLRSALLRPEPARRSIDVRPNIAEIQKWCLVLNTADYCATTAGQLEDKLREKIHADFKDAVSLDDERSIFNTLVAYAVQTLARELELCSEPIWNSMLRPAVPWSQIQPRTDRAHEARRRFPANSQYVTDLASLLEQIGVVVRQDVENKRYVRSWCDKVVSVVTTRFLQALVRLRPLSQPMADQLLADASALRKSLVDLPRYPIDELGVGTDGSVGATEANLSHWTPALSPEQAALSSQAASLRALRPIDSRSASTFSSASSLRPSNHPMLRAMHSATSSTRTLRSWPTDRLPTFKRCSNSRACASSTRMRLSTASSRPLSAHEAEAAEGARQLADQSFLSQLDMDPPSQPVLSSPFTPATPSFLDTNARAEQNSQRSTSLFAPDSLRSPTVGSAATFESQSQPGGAGRAFSDLRKFGNFFGALGRKDSKQ
ncbi:hypothetical protein LUZ63_021721 [Rhynchospora breviuscula]|uniref:Vps53 N-terminal domain-containing protein n=1 Tax=Rhynchospora breviuscula TaxID=2022672 RepID=A0A9Q0BYJ9_9POAL|nr:hypothetical protein LUZ63_021721 [Rhynchospora breviuscula]